MPFESSEARSETLARREYLQRLRERAVERMSHDEFALVKKPSAVSRRDSLRWLGLAAVAAAAGARPLRALTGAASGVLAARAEGVGSSRIPAPQYGAPSWPAPREPYPPTPPTSPATSSRVDLGDVKLWHDVWAQVIVDKNKAGVDGLNQVAAKEGYYTDSWGGGTHTLLALADPRTKVGYIVRGNQSFYATVSADMCSFLVGPGVLLVHGSLYSSKDDHDGLAGVIAGFTKVSDQEAFRRDLEETKINLEKGLPQMFWIRNNDLGWERSRVSVASAERRGDILKFSVRSDAYEQEATFTFDLQRMRLLTTSFDGKEWAS